MSKNTDIAKDKELQIDTLPVNNKKSKVKIDNKKSNKSQKAKGEKKSLWQKIKGIFSELKKVSWPSFGQVAKQTTIVIVVVIICTVILFGVDSLFSLLYKLLTKGV